MKKSIICLLTLAIFIVGISFFVSIESEALLMIEQLLTIFLPTIIICSLYHRISQYKLQDIKQFYSLKLPNKSSLLLSVIVLILTPFVVYFIADIFEVFVGAVPEDETILKQDGKIAYFSASLMLYNLIYTSIMPGICEEFLFRGAVLGLSRQLIKSPFLLVIFNGFLFAAFHQSIEQFFYTFALGMILCTLVLITRSLYCSIFVHIFYNFLADLPDIFNSEIFSSAHSVLEFFHGNTNIFTFIISLILMYAVFKLHNIINLKEKS